VFLPWAQQVLSIHPLNAQGALILAIVSLASYCWLELVRRLTIVAHNQAGPAA
jgi:hypothetical protein